MSKAKRLTTGWLLALSLILLLLGAARAEENLIIRFYLPIAVNTPPAAPVCDLPNTNYQTIGVHHPVSINVETNPEYNLGYRGYVGVNAPLHLVTYDSNYLEVKAPQFPAMFADNRVPVFTSAHQRYRWDPLCDCPKDFYSRWPVTVLGMGVSSGETIFTPKSGYDIGGGYEYIVMYAAPTRATLHIGDRDNFDGYVIYVEDVCVDSDLLALYRALNAAGRHELPALRGHQPFGVALGSEIKVAVRDYGSFMDPRSRRDWWQGR